jgi:hypothetical protein
MPELADRRCPDCDSGRLKYVALMRDQRPEERLVACRSCDRISTVVELTHDSERKR